MSKDGWEIKKLGDVCETGAGGTPIKSHKEYYLNGKIPWLRSGEVCKKDITTSELFITEAGLKNSSAKYFPINTVLVAMYGATAGQTGILRFKATTNQAVCGILPNEKFIPDFIYYYFLCTKDFLVAQAVGGAQPNISQIKIANTKIPLPPLAEQKRIVKILDEKFATFEQLKSNAQKNLDNAKELFQAELSKSFSNKNWEKKRLGDVCEIARGGSPRPISDYITNKPDGINWIKIGDTDPTGKYIYSTKEKIKPEGKTHSRYVKIGDFLLSNSMSFGRPYILKTDGCIHDGWLVLRNYHESLIVDFLLFTSFSNSATTI